MQTRGILRDPSLPTPTPDLPSVLLSLSQRSSHHYSSHAPRLQLCPGSSPSEPTRVSSPTQISPPAPGLLPQVHYSLSFWPSSSISSKKSYLIPLAGDNTPSLQHAVNSLVQRRLQGMEMHRTVNEWMHTCSAPRQLHKESMVVTMLHHQEDPRQTESGRNKAGSLWSSDSSSWPWAWASCPLDLLHAYTQSSSLLDKLPRVHCQEMPFTVLCLLWLPEAGDYFAFDYNGFSV